jgi:hypothetical protein
MGFPSPKKAVMPVIETLDSIDIELHGLSSPGGKFADDEKGLLNYITAPFIHLFLHLLLFLKNYFFVSIFINQIKPTRW